MIAARSSTVAYPPPVWPWPHLFVLLSVLLLQPVWMVASLPVASTPSMPNVAALPLTFVPNMGQFDPVVQAEARTPQATMSFAATEVTFALPDSTLRLQFQGANPYAEITGTQSLPGVVNYLYGNDAAHWQRNVPTYAGMLYKSLYPGIELQYDGHNGNVKGTYTVAPGADPQQIRWRYRGAHNVRIDAAGDVQVAVGGQILTEAAPVAWQTIGAHQVPVPARYALAADGTLSFAVGAYNAAYPLVIDPVLAFSTYLGGNNDDHARAVAVDSAGNMYLTGYTYSSNFPGASNALQGSTDVFITKLNAQGGAVVYSTYLGGSSDEQGNGIALDAAGNAWVTGSTRSPNFPTRNAIKTSFSGGSEDTFAAKLTAQGGLSVSTYLGEPSNDLGRGIAVDAHGNAYVTGERAADFGPEVFAKKLSAAGTTQVYQWFFGKATRGFLKGSSGHAIAVDAQGNAYITGRTNASAFPVVNPFQAMCREIEAPNDCAADDAFVTKLNAHGNALVFSTFLGGSRGTGVDGSGKDVGNAIAVDAAGNVLITGETSAPDFPVKNAVQATKRGLWNFSEAFVTKLTPQGTALVYSTYLGGTASEAGQGIAIDTVGNAYIAGWTGSNDFLVRDAVQPTPGGGVCSDRRCYDGFATHLSATGSAVWSTYVGGSDDEIAYGIAADGAGNAYVSGDTDSSNFRTTTGAVQRTDQPLTDGFLVKIGGTTTQPTTLIKNGGFEVDANGDAKPDNWTAAPQVVRSTAQKHGGTYSMRHQATTNANYVVSQPVSGITAGRAYTATGWTNIPATADTFSFKWDVQWVNASNAVIGTSLIKTYTAATSGWNQATATLTAPAGATTATVRMVVTSLNATVYVDDVVLKP